MKKLFTISAFTLLLSAGAAFAQASAYRAAPNPDSQAYLVPYLGWYDATQRDNPSTQFGLEYRFASYYYHLRPAVGFNFTADGTIYGYGGVFWDLKLTDYLYLTPNFVAGLYEDGGGKDLGGTVEFRSGIELSYQMANMHRIGVAFNHISNASMYNHNPGAETILINYHVPVANLAEWF